MINVHRPITTSVDLHWHRTVVLVVCAVCDTLLIVRVTRESGRSHRRLTRALKPYPFQTLLLFVLKTSTCERVSFFFFLFFPPLSFFPCILFSPIPLSPVTLSFSLSPLLTHVHTLFFRVLPFILLKRRDDCPVIPLAARQRHAGFWNKTFRGCSSPIRPSTTPRLEF